jgi:hypothetical protein
MFGRKKTEYTDRREPRRLMSTPHNVHGRALFDHCRIVRPIPNIYAYKLTPPQVVGPVVFTE